MSMTNADEATGPRFTCIACGGLRVENGWKGRRNFRGRKIECMDYLLLQTSQYLHVEIMVLIARNVP